MVALGLTSFEQFAIGRQAQRDRNAVGQFSVWHPFPAWQDMITAVMRCQLTRVWMVVLNATWQLSCCQVHVAPDGWPQCLRHSWKMVVTVHSS